MNREEIKSICYDDHEDFKWVTESTIDEQSRWSVYKSVVVKQISTDKLFNVWWGEGATEYQEGQDEPCGMNEVEPYEVTVIKYRNVKGGISFEG
jgi:hypothetical protein